VTRRPWEWPDAWWAGALTAAFFCVAAVGIAHHELWRDEWQAWMIARDSASIPQLLAELRHEGHPPTWYLILFLLSRFTRSPVAMQLAHLAMATGSIYLLARFAPLPWLHKVLMAFGYFLAYEYTIIARHYALGVLALFAFCALFPTRHRHPVAVFLVLLVLASSSVFGLILSMAAGAMLLVEAVAGSRERAVTWLRRPPVLMGAAAWLAGLAILTLAIRPPQGFADAIDTGGLSRWALASTAARIPRAYLPLPDLGAEHIWNSHVLPTGSREALALGLVLALLLGVGAVLLFLRKPAVLFLFLAGTGSLLAFRLAVFSGMMRHHGHLFLVFVACLWLAALPVHTWRLPAWLDRWRHPGARLGTAFVTGILLVQVAAAGVLYAADVRGHFSAAPEAAAFLRAHGLDALPIGASPAPVGSSVAGVLDRPIHYIVLRAPGTFVRYARYPRGHDRDLTMARIRPFLDSVDSDAILLLGSPFEDWDPDLEVTELVRFPPGLEHREGYVIYRVGRAAR
jgi:hypothetical protein